MAQQHFDTLLYIAGGAASPVIGWMVGVVELGNVGNTVLLAALGATVSYLVKEALDELKKRLKK